MISFDKLTFVFVDSSLPNSKVSWQVLQKPFTSALPPPACRVLFWQTSDESQFEVKLARAGSIFVAHFDASPLSRPVAPKYIKYYQRAGWTQKCLETNHGQSYFNPNWTLYSPCNYLTKCTLITKLAIFYSCHFIQIRCGFTVIAWNLGHMGLGQFKDYVCALVSFGK